jgi:hypothetical protein
MKRTLATSLALVAAFSLLAFAAGPWGTTATGEDGRIYITDRTGERWDVTEAAALGFKPGRFQYGIGRHAFQTLDDSHLSAETKGAPERMRVIGVEGEGEAQAYSIRQLSWHEVANTHVDGKPIAVGY